MKKLSNKKLELFGLYLYFIFFYIIFTRIKINHLGMSLIYFGIPNIYFLLKKRKFFNKIIVGSFLMSIPITLIFDTIAHQSQSWYESTVFHFRILDIFPLETFIWCFNYIAFVVLFYMFFFDRYSTIRLGKSFKYFYILFVVILLVFLSVFIINKELLNIANFYSISISIFILITIIGLIKYPNLYTKLSLVSILLFIPSIFHELISLKWSHWYFLQGNHFGYVTLQSYTFPIEELLWIIFIPIFILVLEEIFADNRK